MITSFGSHLNVDLQQRGVEFTQLFGNYKHLRPPLLEKMPAMQISRISSQNGESGGSFDDNSPDVIENGIEMGGGGSGSHALIESNMNTMGDNTVSELPSTSPQLSLQAQESFSSYFSCTEYTIGLVGQHGCGRQRFGHGHRPLECCAEKEHAQCEQ